MEEFWGVQITRGSATTVENQPHEVLHLSQACLTGVGKNKETKPVYLFAHVGDRKHVIGILSAKETPRVSFDLVFNKSFKLSHSGEEGIVHVLGYRAPETLYYENSDPESEDLGKHQCGCECADENNHVNPDIKDSEQKVDTCKRKPAKAVKKKTSVDKKAKLVIPEKSDASTYRGKSSRESDQPKQQIPKPSKGFTL